LIEVSRTIGVVLAAGRSQRFGADKLLQPLHGQPLGAHIAIELANLPLLQRIAVCPLGKAARRQIYSSRGFLLLDNAQPGGGMGTSLALAAQHALAVGADALLVCLADMPHIPASHLQGLLALARLDRNAATEADGLRGPPVAIGAHALAGLAQLSGDHGARHLLAAAAILPAAAELVRDYDVPADFFP
jgi:molybdenum cofactor cytidylyltransferase